MTSDVLGVSSMRKLDELHLAMVEGEYTISWLYSDEGKATLDSVRTLPRLTQWPHTLSPTGLYVEAFMRNTQLYFRLVRVIYCSWLVSPLQVNGRTLIPAESAGESSELHD